MNYTDLHYQIALTQLFRVGPVKAKEMLSRLEHVEELFSLAPNRLHKLTGMSISFIRGLQREQALQKAVSIAEHLQKYRIEPIFYTDAAYPERLRNCIDGPILLYKKGPAPLSTSKMVSIVGTRNATSYGVSLCRELVAALKDMNATIVSGLALGIDSVAHQSSLENNISTIAVLGHGLDRIYPQKNIHLAQEIVHNGALLTEFVPGTEPDKENFPKRNRIVAGLCDVTVVIESKRKGGSLITASLANDYNRDVFAYPGSVHQETSRGCNDLIAAQKAHLIQSPDDLLRLMSWKRPHKKAETQKILFTHLTPIQKSIMEAIIQTKQASLDLLSLKTKLPVSSVSHELFELELNGVVRSLPGMLYAIA